MAYVEKGRLEEAGVEFEELLKIDPMCISKEFKKMATWNDARIIGR